MAARKGSFPIIRPAIAAAAIFLAAARVCAGPVFAPGQKLFTIKTEHFDIIFSEPSRPTALALASFAEDALSYVEGELSLPLPRRLPVAITPDIGSFNGYMTPLPYPHIVLFDTALDPRWTAFENNLRGLFIHELTHAVSLQSRAPWADFLSGVFGSWISPALANAPEFMVEGVTVGLEGEGGPGGRAADPLVKERIRQDIRENRFKSPLECEGVYDAYPGGDVFYEYGGLFTAYLRERYGKESYARLWESLGDLIPSLSLDPYERGFFKAFEKVYGLGFEEAWADFRDAMALGGIEEAPERIGPERPQSISSLAAGGSSLFWADGFEARALELDVATGATRVLFPADSSCAITDASADGSRLLVYRSVVLPDSRDRLETALFDVAAGRFVPALAAPGLRDARFFRDGYVGIAPNLHDTDLVLVRGAERVVLLPGSEGVMYSSPAVLDEDRIALVVCVGARRAVGIYDAGSGKLDLVRPEGDPDGPDARILDYVRGVSASGGRLWLDYDSDDRLYKLGAVEGLDGEGPRLVRVEETDRSGGVFGPVELGDRVYYAGRFSEGFRICVAPGTVSGEGGTRTGGEKEIAYRLEPFDPEAIREEAEGSIAEAARTARVEPYRPLAYLNPFRFWVPYVDPATIGRSFRPFALFYMGDPISANTVFLTAGYDSSYPMADLGLEWICYDLPVVLDFSLADGLRYGASDRPERLSSASASASLALPLFPRPRAIRLGLGGEVFARASGTSDSPYGWGYAEPGAVASLYAAWKGRTIGPYKSSGRGLDLIGYYDLELDEATSKVETDLIASLDRPALRLDLWAAWADHPILRLDSTSKVFSSDRRPSYYEYADSGRGAADLCVQGTASWRLADQPIRSEILGLYLNRLLLDSGYRGAYFDGEYLQSCFARASLDLSAGVGALGAVGFRIFAEAFARLDGGAPADALGFRLGGTLRGDLGPTLRPGAGREEP
jgi:hypothetical protein